MAPQRRHERGLEPAPGGDPIAHVAFAGAQPPVDEQRVIATLLEMHAEIDGLNRGPADIQPRDNARNANRNRDVVGRRHADAIVLEPRTLSDAPKAKSQKPVS